MIKAIIFDFGNIFINLDKDATSRSLKEMDIDKLPDVLQAKNEEYEQGFITSDEISEHYRAQFPQLQTDDFLTTWNAMLLEFPEYRFKFIQKLAEKDQFELILLSNTNENHINFVKNKVSFYKDFKACFDGFYLSHEIGLRKPNPEIFEYILEKHQLKPEDCLFIDDTKEHINTAASLGIHTWNLQPTREDVIDLFTSQKQLF